MKRFLGIVIDIGLVMTNQTLALLTHFLPLSLSFTFHLLSLSFSRALSLTLLKDFRICISFCLRNVGLYITIWVTGLLTKKILKPNILFPSLFTFQKLNTNSCYLNLLLITVFYVNIARKNIKKTPYFTSYLCTNKERRTTLFCKGI